jgi:hypothetical protein
LNLQKTFENRQDSGRLSKVAGAALPAFSKENCVNVKIFSGFQTNELALAGFQNLWGQLQEICYPIGI